MQAGQGILLAYSILVAAGGLIGYVKAGSFASLVSGLVCGALGMIAFGVTYSSLTAGYAFGLALALLLSAFFGVRLQKTQKFMPSGLMMLISLVVFACMAAFTAVSVK